MDRHSLHRLLLSLALVCVAGAGACATRRPVRGQEVDGLDRKLSTFTYIEQGDLITLIVDTHAARDRDGQRYMPLEIAVANTGVRRITLSRESFTLIDSEGTRYPMATQRELLAGYRQMEFDRYLAELEGIVFNRFAAFQRYPSNFSPPLTTGRTVIDHYTLPKGGYVLDFIYFPEPRTGIRDQRFELFLDAPQLEDPVFVKFEVR